MNFENSNFEPTEYLPYDFANRRHIGPSPQEMEKMLKLLGLTNIDQLIDQTIPPAIRQKKSLDWEPRSTVTHLVSPSESFSSLSFK